MNITSQMALYRLGYLNARFITFQEELTPADIEAFQDLYDFLMSLEKEDE